MNAKLPFLFYMLATGGLVFLIFLTPYLAFQGDPLAGFLYDDVFSNVCHQKISRSFCLFQDSGGYHFGDCLPQNGIYREDLRSEKSAFHEGMQGYKFPVSARDMFIYIGMYAGGLLLWLQRKSDSTDLPLLRWFILALAPIAVDGITQSILGWRESTNLLRAITGFMAGFAVPFYAVPLLNRYFGKREGMT